MLYVNWRFTLIALSVVPVLFAVVYYLTRRIKQASRAVRKKESEMTSIVEEALTSVAGGQGIRPRRLRRSKDSNRKAWKMWRRRCARGA